MPSRMKLDVLRIVVVAAALLCMPFGVQAAVILQDLFAGSSGSPVNSAKWTASSQNAVYLNGSGQVKVDNSTGYTATLIGKNGGSGSYGFKPTSSMCGRMVISGLYHNSNGYFCSGLTTDGSASHEIMLRTSSYPYVWYLSVIDGSNIAQFYTDVSSTVSATHDWVIEWYAGRVVVYCDGQVKADTSIDTPSYTEGNGFDLPKTALVPWASQWGGSYSSIDGITWGAAPVPTNMVDPYNLFQDDFYGNANANVNSAKWAVSDSNKVKLDGVGDVNIASPANIIGLGSGSGKYGIMPDIKSFCHLEISHLNHTVGGWAGAGLSSDTSGTSSIIVYSSSSPSVWFLQVQNGSNLAQFNTDVTHYSNGDWDIYWYTDHILLYYNGILKVNTATATPNYTQGSGLQIPTTGLVPYVTKWGGDYLKIKSITYRSVPLGLDTHGPLSDIFSGAVNAPVNPAKWTAGSSAGAKLVDGDGDPNYAELVKLDSDAGTASIIAVGGGSGDYGFAPDSTMMARLTISSLVHTIGGCASAGLTTDGSATKEIMLRSSSDYGGNWVLRIANDSNVVVYDTGVPRLSSTGDWMIDNYSNRAIAYYNGVSKVDTSYSSPIPGFTTGTGLNIPNVPMAPFVNKTCGNYLTITGITWDWWVLSDSYLVADWSMNEGIGTDVNDSSGYGNNGVFNGSPTWATGWDSTCLNFGDNAHVDFTGSSLNIGTTHTVSAWIKLSSEDTYGSALLGKQSSSDDIRLASNNIYYNCGGYSVSVPWSYSPMTQFHHLAIVRSGTSVSFYVDGIQQGSTQTLGSNPSARFDRIGGRGNSTAYDWFGLIDEVRIYSTALSATDITNLYLGSAHAASKKLLHWGYDVADLGTVQNNITTIEANIPAFNGLVLQSFKVALNGGMAYFDLDGFGSHAFAISDFSSYNTITSLECINFQKFTDNFLRFDVAQQQNVATPDWYDDSAFNTICANVGLWAGVAKEGCYKGIMLDTEDYNAGHSGNHAMFKFPNIVNSGHNYNSYARKVRFRGNQIMSALQAAYPDIVIIMTVGDSYVKAHHWDDNPGLSTSDYGLLPSFIIGMLEVAGPRVRIIDGAEEGFANQSSTNYYGQLDLIQEGVLNDTDYVPSELWMAYWGEMNPGMSLYWNNVFVNLTGLTQQQRETMWSQNVYNALKVSTKYVWSYSDNTGWWEPGPAPNYYTATQATKTALGTSYTNVRKGNPWSSQ